MSIPTRTPMNIPTTAIPIPTSMFMSTAIPMNIPIPMTTCMRMVMSIITTITIMNIITMSIPMRPWRNCWP